MTNLEGKIQGAVIIFSDDIVYTGAGFLAVHLGRREGNILNGFANFAYYTVEAVYEPKGSPEWQNWDIQNHRQIRDVPEHLKSTQLVLSDNTVYEGASMGGLHFSFFDHGRYIGHDHFSGFAIDFPYSKVKAIFDREGKLVWENFDYKPKSE